MVGAHRHLQTLRMLLKISNMTTFKPLIYVCRRSMLDNPDSLHSQSFCKSAAAGATPCSASHSATFPGGARHHLWGHQLLWERTPQVTNLCRLRELQYLLTGKFIFKWKTAASSSQYNISKNCLFQIQTLWESETLITKSIRDWNSERPNIERKSSD